MDIKRDEKLNTIVGILLLEDLLKKTPVSLINDVDVNVNLDEIMNMAKLIYEQMDNEDVIYYLIKILKSIKEEEENKQIGGDENE